MMREEVARMAGVHHEVGFGDGATMGAALCTNGNSSKYCADIVSSPYVLCVEVSKAV
jgi:hypothetical protein